MKKTLNFLKTHLFDIVVLTLVVFSVGYHFLFGTVLVSGHSMEPSYFDGDLIVMQSINTDLDSGDVVSLNGKYITEATGVQYNNMIKRVVAVPGDTVTIQDNQVYVNGVVESDDYLAKDMIGNTNLEYELAEDEYYVLGDNRNFSVDSRIFGPVHRDAISSRTLVTIYSPAK